MDEILSLTEVAVLMGLSRSRIYQIWHEWEDKGVRILKAYPNGQPRFFKQDIINLMQSGYKTT
jgi:transposase